MRRGEAACGVGTDRAKKAQAGGCNELSSGDEETHFNLDQYSYLFRCVIGSVESSPPNGLALWPNG